jgi:hypothetical protein
LGRRAVQLNQICSFGVLVNRHHDRLDMVIAPAFVDTDPAGFRQGFEKSWLVVSVALPLRRLAHHQVRPPSTLGFRGLFSLEPVPLGAKVVDVG